MNDELRLKLEAHRTYLKKHPAGFVYRGTKQARTTPVPHAEQQVSTSTRVAPQAKQPRLDAIKCAYGNCNACPLATQGRAQVVFGIGNPDTKLMFIGEAPGRDEDKQGQPFVGRAGQLLTKIIEAMGLTREQVYISNVVKCRPPENRAPLPNESSVCKDLILFNEIDIIKPTIICTLGATATQAILGEDTKITKARGQFFAWGDTLVLPTYHPAYLLRNPAEKRTVWDDMQKIMAKLTELANTK